VTPHPLLIETLGDSEMIGNRAVTTMEGRIEARYLRHIRPAFQQRADRSEVVRLMQRREAGELFQLGQYLLIDHNRLVVVRTAVYNTMAYSGKFKIVILAQPGADLKDGGRHVRHLLARIVLIEQNLL